MSLPLSQKFGGVLKFACISVKHFLKCIPGEAAVVCRVAGYSNSNESRVLSGSFREGINDYAQQGRRHASSAV